MGFEVLTALCFKVGFGPTSEQYFGSDEEVIPKDTGNHA